MNKECLTALQDIAEALQGIEKLLLDIAIYPADPTQRPRVFVEVAGEIDTYPHD